MKKLAVLALFVGVALQAQAKELEGSISCTSLENSSDINVTVEARLVLFVKQNEATMWDPIVTASAGDEAKSTGRAPYLEADEKYVPRKYKKHTRFNFSNLVDTKTFGKFYPMDQCKLSFLMPNNGLSRESFTAPMIINCDQGGGTISLECEVTPRD